MVSIEMMEALGDRYLETYFAKIHEVLKPGGLVALQYITVPDSRHAELRRGIDWIQKHIFPGSLLLSVGRVNHGAAIAPATSSSTTSKTSAAATRRRSTSGGRHFNAQRAESARARLR